MVLESNGRMSPCCLWNYGNLPDHDKPSALVGDPFNQTWMEKIRQGILSNQTLPGCNECHMREASGVSSYRQAFNVEYGRPTEAQLRYIEFNLGNLCNLKCRMCGSWSSSKWAADETALGLVPDDLVRPRIDMLLPYVASIEKLRFIGGEPSLEQDALIAILEKVLAARNTLQHLHVVITTNCMVLFEQSLLDLLCRCKRVELQCSIDGYDQINDYQRTGADWSILTHNLSWYQNNLSTVFDLMILTSWSLINANSAIELLTFVQENLPRFYLWGHLVREPSHLDICNIPNAFKVQLTAKLRSWTIYDDKHWIQHNKQVIISQLGSDPNLSPSDVLKNIARLDQLRNENFADIDPEMHAALVAACENHNKA